MENFKLTLADFIEVPEADRVQGKEYWVADEDNVPQTKVRYHSGNYCMDNCGTRFLTFGHWYTLKHDPNDLGQFFNYVFYNSMNNVGIINSLIIDFETFCHNNSSANKLPALTVPEQTEAERVLYLQAELAKLQPKQDEWKPQFGEVVLVGDIKDDLRIRIFIEMVGGKFKCVNSDLDSDNVKDFKAGKPYAKTNWLICKRLNGEIITPNP